MRFRRGLEEAPRPSLTTERREKGKNIDQWIVVGTPLLMVAAALIYLVYG